MSNISYRGKTYDAAQLVAIAGQGVAIEVDRDQIETIPGCVPIPEDAGKAMHIVAKNGNQYDMLASSLLKLVTPEGQRIQGKVKVILLTKHVLAKAEASGLKDRLRQQAAAESYENEQSRYMDRGRTQNQFYGGYRSYGRDRFN